MTNNNDKSGDKVSGCGQSMPLAPHMTVPAPAPAAALFAFLPLLLLLHPALLHHSAAVREIDKSPAQKLALTDDDADGVVGVASNWDCRRDERSE